MAVTVSYRGSLPDLARVEDFEDRILDLALELGAQARIWRSLCQDDRRRVVRGLYVDLFPGQETTSLLIAPEGWLINLGETDAAEHGQLQQPPWCAVQTQFGPVEGHVALVELLAALKHEFLPDLEIRDAAGYWESRDVAALQLTFARVQASVAGLTKGIQHPASPAEAGEPGLMAARAGRVARLVRRILARPAEHPPVHYDDDDVDFDFDNRVVGTEADWDASYKENRRKQERLHRAIEERVARGEDRDGVFEAAMRDEGLIDLPGEPSFSEALREFEESWEDEEEEEPWRASRWRRKSRRNSAACANGNGAIESRCSPSRPGQGRSTVQRVA
jgi:hypothetical protein